MTMTAEPFPVRALAGRLARQAERDAKMRQLLVGFEYDPGERWKDQAGCSGASTDLFVLLDAKETEMSSSQVADENARRNAIARRKFCENGCAVVAECLGYALLHEMQGTWAGELFTMADIYAARRVRKQLFEESL
jgi:hypothetical protein